MIFLKLDSYRIVKNREFFKVDIDVIIDAIESVIQNINVDAESDDDLKGYHCDKCSHYWEDCKCNCKNCGDRYSCWESDCCEDMEIEMHDVGY